MRQSSQAPGCERVTFRDPSPPNHPARPAGPYHCQSFGGGIAGDWQSNLPPDFVRRLEGKGLNTRYCWDCVHSASYDAQTVCSKYGAYVLIYSSCSDFERRVGSDQAVLKAEELKERFKPGLNDLRK